MNALVTGASRGIGREVARRLAQAGCHVFAGVREKGAAPPGTEELLLDVGEPSQIKAAARRAGPLDVLVNNAGINRAPAKEMYRVNVRGPLLLIRAAQLRQGARVVNVSSGMGQLSGQPPELVQRLAGADLAEIARIIDDAPGGYGATKAVLNRMTQLLAAQLSNLRINAISPGWVKTDMGGQGAPRSLEQGAESILWGTREDAPTGGYFQDGHALEW